MADCGAPRRRREIYIGDALLDPGRHGRPHHADPTTLGNEVTIGHNAHLEGCTSRTRRWSARVRSCCTTSSSAARRSSAPGRSSRTTRWFRRCRWRSVCPATIRRTRSTRALRLRHPVLRRPRQPVPRPAPPPRLTNHRSAPNCRSVVHGLRVTATPSQAKTGSSGGSQRLGGCRSVAGVRGCYYGRRRNSPPSALGRTRMTTPRSRPRQLQARLERRRGLRLQAQARASTRTSSARCRG